MSQLKPSQQCPICGSRQPLTARTCAICGAVLPGQPTPVTVPAVRADSPREARLAPRFDPAQGDDDLYAGDLIGRLWRVLLLVAVGIAIAAAAVILVLRPGGDEGTQARTERLGSPSPTIPVTATLRGTRPAITPLPTRTFAPALAFATVTPQPEPTEVTPCMQTAGQGDTVYGMAIRCGHRDMAVVDLILEINHMKSATELQLGQTLEIPWPTATPGGEPTEAPAPDAGSAPDSSSSFATATPGVELNEFGTPSALAAYQDVEPTLRPGLAWHSVQPGETILSIALDYGTTLETLSQLNKEIPFYQCDYSSPTGGQNCSVLLSVGDRVRVPVPLPTPTTTPSPVGTLTPTPTGTPTFNAPFVSSPADGTRFFADQTVVVRWGETGTLGPDERYLVRVRDKTTGQEYQALVKETSYELPGGWQPSDLNTHEFEWTVSLATVDAQNNVLAEDHVTDPRTFTWDSR